MGAAVFAVALVCAQVETGSVATATVSETSTGSGSLDALLADIGEDPLTSAELELLERLGAETATVAATASIAWPAPEDRLWPSYRTGQERRRETIARSTREALDAMALPAISFRGGRRRVLYEGLLLAPLAEGVLDADVRLFDRVEVMTSASRRDHAGGAQGTIALYGPSPESGIHPEASVEARSADRSAGAFAAVEGGVPVIRARVAGAFDDTRALRTAGEPDPSTDHERWLASVRAELFGGEGDLVSIALGGDLDRAHNTRITDELGEIRGVATLDQRVLAFARASIGSQSWGVSLLGGYQGLRQHQELDEMVFFDVDADLFQGRLSAFVMPYEWLRFEAGGHVAFGSGTVPQEVSRRELEAFVFGSLLFESVQADVGLRVAHQRFGDDISELRPLPQVALHVPIAGPVGIRACFDLGMTVPGGNVFAPASGFRAAETTSTIEAGPTLKGDSYWAVLTGFASWIRQPLEPTPDPMILATPRSMRVLGVELDGAFSLVDGFDIAFTGSLSEAVDRDTGLETYSPPVLSGLLALRYRFDFQNAHVEVHARGATKPLALIGDEPISGWMIAGERPRGFVRAGIMGGLDLPAGFTLDLAVENAFDRRYRLQTTDRQGGGIDVRAALSWRY